ncbi:MAG: lytic transglycosylase domain-containing protein [Alphaproteobacteria bacterium]|nr:lytic transglycosylase domain-containing protein [Alphaproteobacteria bacterium]
MDRLEKAAWTIWAALAVFVAMGFVGQSWAAPGLAEDNCRVAIMRAERAHRIPADLMHAISLVESGRYDRGRQAKIAWPWTINAEGQGRFFATKAEAIEAVDALQARGVRSIDVGCMQVNLMYHRDAFDSLEEAFDPVINASYAARFLIQLKDETGGWPAAVQRYHSAKPEKGGPYRVKVDREWREERLRLAEERQRDAVQWSRVKRAEALSAGLVARGLKSRDADSNMHLAQYDGEAAPPPAPAAAPASQPRSAAAYSYKPGNVAVARYLSNSGGGQGPRGQVRPLHGAEPRFFDLPQRALPAANPLE